jgi:hypothetical protein
MRSLTIKISNHYLQQSFITTIKARESIELLLQFEFESRVVVGRNEPPYRNINKIEEVNIKHRLDLSVIEINKYKDMIEFEETAIQLNVIGL